MPSALPDGDPAPADGALPADALATLGTRSFGMYVHVPFCLTRCGYCDFNTYTAAELGGGGDRASYAQHAANEIRLARRVLGTNAGAVDTVFFGGGTPTLLPPADLATMLEAIRTEFGLAADAEVTTEANPESVDADALQRLRDAGFNRISFGMQSAAEHVLATLDRQHSPGRVQQCVEWARAAGFEHVSVDLIYGTPGEADADWLGSLRAAVATGVDHISAYALVIEDGTRMAAQVRRGELTPPDDDVLADRYELADDVLSQAGLAWYEVSNWARDEPSQCAHNVGYWKGADWWGVGPGAHSHVGGVRWWNVRHPAAYAQRLAAGDSPAAGREILTPAQQHAERVLLELRLSSGLDLAVLDDAGQAAANRAATEGLLVPSDLDHGRATLTRRGRLLADAVVRDLLP